MISMFEIKHCFIFNYNADGGNTLHFFFIMRMNRSIQLLVKCCEVGSVHKTYLRFHSSPHSLLSVLKEHSDEEERKH